MPENMLYYGDNLDVLRRHIKDETVARRLLPPSEFSVRWRNDMSCTNHVTFVESTQSAVIFGMPIARGQRWDGHLLIRPGGPQ